MTGDQLLVVLGGVTLAILLVGGISGWVSHSRRQKLVIASSAALAQVVALNQRFPRLQVRWETVTCNAAIHVDSKAKFDRAQPEQLLLTAVHESEDDLRRQVNDRLAARREYDEYLRLHEDLRTWLGCSGAPQLDPRSYQRFERKLFSRMQLTPPNASACVSVSVAYRSPAGRNRYFKNAQADFDGLVALLSELELKRRQQSTTMFLRKQERSRVTARLRYQVLQRDRSRCRNYGASAAEGIVLHVDHIRPVSKGGRSDLDNLQTLCQDCNLGKGNRL